jgi:hypothetical protein
MGIAAPPGTTILPDGTARYRCSACASEFVAARLRFADGVWAVVSAVFCCGDCMTKALGLSPSSQITVQHAPASEKT